MSAEESLVFKGKFDPSGIETGTAKAEAALDKLEKRTATVFSSMGKSANSIWDKHGEKGWLFVNAPDPAALKAKSDKALQINEEAYDERIRQQARFEDEYQSATYQANLAEAGLVQNRWDRAIAIQRVMMKKEIGEYAGNLEAQEQILRKHNAIIASIEMQMVNSGDRPNRVILTRLGTIAASTNRVQGVLFGVSPLLGNLGGGLAQAAGGLMGVEAALNAVAQGGKAMMISLGASLGVLVAIGIAIAVIVKHRKEMAELREEPDWLGDPAKFEQVTAAVKRYTDAQTVLQMRIDRNTKAGRPAVDMMALYSKETRDASEATKELEKLTGRSGDELKKWLAQFGGGKSAVDAFFRTTQGRFLAAQAELKAARLEAMEDGLKKELAAEDNRHQASLDAEQTYLDSVLLNEKSTQKQKDAAQKSFDAATEQHRLAHLQRIENINAEARRKEQQADAQLYEKGQSDFLRAQEERQKAETEAVKRQVEIESDAHQRRLTEEERLADAKMSSDEERFVKANEKELQGIADREAAIERMTDVFTRSYLAQEIAAEKLAVTERQRLETEEKINATQAKLYDSTLGLASALAGMFDNSRMQRYVNGMLQWLNILRQGQQVLQTMKTLELLGGIAATGGAVAPAAGVGGPLGMLGLLLGFADGGMRYGRNSLARMNESGDPEAVLNPRGVAAAGGRSGVNALNSGLGNRGGGLTVSFGDIIVPAGADMGAIKSVIMSGVEAAYQQQEAQRGAGFYADGTLPSN